jgi:hypothetical protein
MLWREKVNNPHVDGSLQKLTRNGLVHIFLFLWRLGETEEYKWPLTTLWKFMWKTHSREQNAAVPIGNPTIPCTVIQYGKHRLQ